jgi:hypothetical protein
VAALLAFGVTVTNLAAVFVLALATPAGERVGRRLRRAAAFASLVVAIAAALSLAQKAAYPESELFFVKSSFTEEASYVFRPATPGEAFARAASVGGHLLFANLAAPRVEAVRSPPGPPGARFGSPRPAGWLHGALLAAVSAVAALGLVKRRLALTPLVGALLAWIAFNAALHFVYGQVLFLYSCHWTFAVIAVVAAGLEAAVAGRWRHAASVAVLLLVLLQLVANAGFVRELYALYG